MAVLTKDHLEKVTALHALYPEVSSIKTPAPFRDRHVPETCIPDTTHSIREKTK